MKKSAKYASFKNGKIAYSDEGKGKVVVLLHGFLGSKELWGVMRAELAKHFRVISIDLPGHGKSDCFGYVHSMDLMAGAAKAVLDHLKIKRCVITGHSMGGYTTLAFAELYPEYLRGICLFHSTSFADSDEKKKDRDKAVKSVKKNPLAFVRASIQNLFAEKNLRRFKGKVNVATKIAAATPKQGIVAALEGMKDRPSRDSVLHYAEYPILFIVGKYDNVLPMQSLLDQAKLCKDGKAVLLENSGHMGFIEEREKATKNLAQFVRKSYRSR